MKIVIAPDSFKDSLSAEKVADAIAVGLAEVLPHAHLVKCPMADGGEGTVEAIVAAGNGQLRRNQVQGPLGEPVEAHWGWLPDSHTAIIEMAEASGLQLVAPAQRDACISSTYGTGELIRAALDAGARRVILAIGGSATNDAGAGALQALGLGLFDDQGNSLARGGLALAGVVRIDLTGLDPRLTEVRFEIAADVNNPLCGEHGASAIFGPQKGASAEQVRLLDQALGHFADHCAQVLPKDVRDEPGSGAAGGLGFAAKAFFGAQFRPGVEVVAELVGLAEAVKDADLVITGEGRFDAQTLRGKTPFGVARIAQANGVPVVVLAGTLGEGYQALYEHGINAAFAIASGPMTLQDACDRAGQLLTDRARDIARLLSL
ncbi:glycerate kinase [Pseudomonas fragi]|uniref:glycerate kinase n=1 Tax=Pseudomonas fragi TaxID=296 RepID=UPI0021C1C326|nr:glycerate kinase [Pseudomonas fragi]UXL40746.1 glycerate kinase [Pseudomonas fragi]